LRSDISGAQIFCVVRKKSAKPSRDFYLSFLFAGFYNSGGIKNSDTGDHATETTKKGTLGAKSITSQKALGIWEAGL